MPNRIFIAKLIALGAAVVSIQQAVAGALDWEIERNFRYFKFSSDIAVHRIAFDLFKAEFKKTPSIDGLERYINDPGFWKKNLVSADAERNSWPKAWRANNLKTPYALIAKLRGLENDRAAVPDASELERLGWASLLVRAQDKSHPNGQTDTCWSTIRRQHTNCTEYGDYVRPQGWVVRIFDKDAAPGSKCAWRGDGGTIIDRLSEAELYGKDGSIKVALNVPWQSRPDRDCDELRVFVPAEPQEPHKVIGSVHVVRIAADNTEAPLTLSPQDLLIVGFGDSFGSGEGNPERGATFDEYLAIRDLLLRARRSPDADYPHFCASHDRDSQIGKDIKCLVFDDFKNSPPPACNTDGENCILKAADSLHVARGPLSRNSTGAEDNWTGVWRPFDANRFYPYVHRTRLFRTPNDVFMLINKRPSIVTEDNVAGILELNGRATSGAFHPTAEAHAIIGAMIMNSIPTQIRGADKPN